MTWAAAYTLGDRVRDVSHGWVGTVTEVTDTDIVVEWDDTGDDTPFPHPTVPRHLPGRPTHGASAVTATTDNEGAATIDWCDGNAAPLLDRLRMHAVEMNGDGCWRGLLNEARAEIATLHQEVALLGGAVQALAGWVRDLDPHPSIDVCDYLTDEDEKNAVRRLYQSVMAVAERPADTDENGSEDARP